MRHGSLFSGIGGIDLGLERAGFETVWQVECELYPTSILERHFPNAKRYPDVRDCGSHNLEPVDIISGGFPCQDISQAGKRAGITGKRSGLWVEMRRIIAELRPRWVLAENVSALRIRGADTVLTDLEEEGYACWPLVVGAWSVGAPHRRERVFLVGYAKYDGFASPALTRSLEETIRDYEERAYQASELAGTGASRVLSEELADSNSVGHLYGQPEIIPTEARLDAQRYTAPGRFAWPARIGEQQFEWEARRVAKPSVGDTIDGLPRCMAIKALGNAVVPQIPEAIGQVILKLDDLLCNKPMPPLVIERGSLGSLP